MMDVVDIKDVAKERAMHNLKAVITGAEELLRVTASNVGAEYASVKQKIGVKFNCGAHNGCVYAAINWRGSPAGLGDCRIL
jgi:hypothetical protein